MDRSPKASGSMASACRAAGQGLAPLHARQNLRNQRWIFDAGNHPQLAATIPRMQEQAIPLPDC
jgi:hypothetical protein